MLFLADESCDACMIRTLRTSGHDVMAISEVHQGADDASVIELAVGTSRILITEDKDLGQLVYASGLGHAESSFCAIPSNYANTLPNSFRLS
jgi:predicted nuclease of predicted toxin-antitoxin system